MCKNGAIENREGKIQSWRCKSKNDKRKASASPIFYIYYIPIYMVFGLACHTMAVIVGGNFKTEVVDWVGYLSLMRSA